MKKIFFLAGVALFLSACQTKESYVSDFNRFVETVRDECAGYSEKDWKEADKKFTRFSEETYKKFAEELSLEEKKEIAKCQTAYTALKAKAGIKDLGKDLKEATKKLDEALKE